MLKLRKTFNNINVVSKHGRTRSYLRRKTADIDSLEWAEIIGGGYVTQDLVAPIALMAEIDRRARR